MQENWVPHPRHVFVLWLGWENTIPTLNPNRHNHPYFFCCAIFAFDLTSTSFAIWSIVKLAGIWLGG